MGRAAHHNNTAASGNGTSSSLSRFTAQHPCPVCAGYDRMPRGQGRRCHGFLSSDGDYAHCSREEKSGGLPQETSETYAHRLEGSCKCGTTHGPEDPPPAKPNGRARPGQPRQRVAEYQYVDRHGELLAKKVRHEPKTFTWEGGNPNVFYRLPELLDSDGTVYIHEGEKAVDAFVEKGLAATCPPTPKWTAELVEPLRSRDVVIFADRDPAGLKRAAAARDAIQPVAKSVKIVQAVVDEPGADGFDHLAAGHRPEDAAPVDEKKTGSGISPSSADRPRPTIEALAFSGRRALELLKRPKPDPVEAGRPVPGHLSLWVAAQFTGKSALTYWNGMSRAAGIAPWDGCDDPPAGRVGILSIDESVEQVVRRMNQLSTFHPAGRLEKYIENIEIVGIDPTVDPSDLDALRLDDGGFQIVREWLERAEHEGRPLKELYIDAYSDFLPLGESENSNEIATEIGGGLEKLAVRFACAITLLHHTGKPKDSGTGDIPDLRFLPRGASALSAKARTVAVLEEMPSLSHLLRVRTRTNLGPSPKALTLQVTGDGGDLFEERHEILYFKPHDPLLTYKPIEYIGSEAISTTDLAWALSGKVRKSGQEPPGDAKRLATQLRNEWDRRGLVEVFEGPRKAKMIRLKEGSE